MTADPAHHGSVAAALVADPAVQAADRAPERVRDRVRVVIADVLAAAVSGAARRDVTALRSALMVGTGPSTVIGSRSGAAPAQAALLNAVPVAAEQLQDGHRRARGHPGSHVVPAVLAVAEQVGASGAQLQSSVLAGYQIAARLGIAMNGTPFGVHDIATWGTVGAAAGVAHLLSHGDADVIAAAIDLAASMPVLPDANTVFGGATGQHLFLGIGAQLGVQHGQAAAAGIRPIPGTLERHFARWSAAAPERVAALVDRQLPGAPAWEVLDGYLKRHPTCGLLHGVNDAVEELAAGGIGAAEVAEVQVRTYLAASTFDEPAPRTDLAARFSIPWTVAAGLTFGVLDHRAFTESALHDKDLLTLAARVQVLHDPDLDAGYPAGRPSSVTVRFGDGRCLRAHSDRPRGDGATAGTDPRIRVKPLALLSRVTDTDWAERLLSTIARLDTVGAADLGTELCVPVRETKCG